MAEVVKGTVGSGFLSGNQQTWWSWKVTWGDVWMFWVDTASSGSVKRVVEIVKVQNQREGDTNLALINLRNPLPDGAVYYLRVARVF